MPFGAGEAFDESLAKSLFHVPEIGSEVWLATTRCSTRGVFLCRPMLSCMLRRRFRQRFQPCQCVGHGFLVWSN